MPTTGPHLRAERRAEDITVVDIAARMGVTRQTVHALERSAIVWKDQALLYRKALADAKAAKIASRDVA
jgi:transcriptional regulator with XRE-family HTH domain